MNDRGDRMELVSGPGADRGPRTLRPNRHDLRRRLRSCRRENGQAVVEFALVVPWIAALFLVLFDMGKVMVYWLNVTQVANEGARIAAVNAACTTGTLCDGNNITDVRAYLRAELDRELTGNIPNGRSANIPDSSHQATITICYPNSPSGDATDAGQPVRIKIRAVYRPTIIPFIDARLFDIPISASATMRLEHSATAPALAGGACT